MTITAIATAALSMALVLLGPSPSTAQSPLPKLRVGPEGRFLVKETGDPFVWVGETNWFFAKLGPEERNSLLNRRKEQGFSMLFIAAREDLYDGSGGPYEGSITKLNEAWWGYLEDYVDEAARRGMYVGVALGWWGHVMRNEPSDLFRNGFEVAQRLNGRTNVVWLVAGEAGGHLRKSTIPRDRMEAIVRGIREGDADDKLLTIHADYQRGTSLDADADLVDFNNWQTSQWCCQTELPRQDPRQWTVWEAISHDYGQTYHTPSGAKPTLDAEAWYERNKDFCGASPIAVRRRAYFTILAGAFGHQYGAGGAWDGLREPDGCSGGQLEALDYEGADDMRHLSALLHSFGDALLELRPRQDIVKGGQSASYDSHIQASQARDGSYAVVYDADGGVLRLDLTGLAGPAVRAEWFDPSTGESTEHDEVNSSQETNAVFTAPSADRDWVLLLRSSEG